MAHGLTLLSAPAMWPAATRPPLHAVGSRSRISAPPHASALLLLADGDVVGAATEGEITASAAVITDTVLDLAVYALLASVVGLTLYSVFVTLQRSNEEYGGWVAKEDEDLGMTKRSGNRLRPGAVYDPVTDQWTYPEKVSTPKVGRAPVGGAADEAAGNRYERRMEKKEAARKKAKKRR